MKRRNILIGMGGIAGAGAAIGTGAFDQVNADRAVSVNVEGDADAYLGLEPINSAYATTDGDGVLELTFDEDGGAGGDGFNPNSTTRIDGVFSISNQGTQDVGVSVEKGGLAGGVDKFDFLAQTDTDEESLVYESPVVLESGESFDVGVEAEISSSDTIDGVIEDDEIVITADIDDEDGADELQPVQNVDQGESYDSIGAAVGAAEEGNTIQVASGTYPERVEIDFDDLTLEGPNAGIHGDSEDRGDEATITDGVFLDENPSGVVVDGFAVERTMDSDNEGVFQIGSTSNPGADDVTIKNNVITANLDSDGTGTIYIEHVGEIQIEDNLLTQTDEESEFTGSGLVEAEQLENTEIVIDGNTVKTDVGVAPSFSDPTPKYTITDNEFVENDIGVLVFGDYDANELQEFEDNSFTGAEGTIYVFDQGDQLDLGEVQEDNQFDPSAVIDDDNLVPE